VGQHQLAVVVMLTGNRAVNGGVAAGVAGSLYKQLSEQQYFAANQTGPTNLPEILTTIPCCSR
jgi:hypothetical protein